MNINFLLPIGWIFEVILLEKNLDFIDPELL